MTDVRKLQLKPMSQEKREKTPALEKVCDFLFMGKHGFVFVFVAVLLVYLMFCVATERALKKSVYNIMREIGANGFGVSYTTETSYHALTSGLYIDNFVLTAPESLGGWTLKTGRLTVSAFPFSEKATLRFDGTHSLTTRNIGDIRLNVVKGRIDYKKPTSSEPFAVLAEVELMTAAAPASMAGFSVRRFQAEISPLNPTAFSFQTETDDLILPAYLSYYLPRTVAHLTATGKLTGFSEKREKPLWADWTDNGGLVELDNAEIVWEPFMGKATGTLAFDGSYRMSGALMAKLYGFFDLLDALDKGSYLQSANVSVAKVVLGENLKKENGEAIESLTASVGLQSGMLYVGPVRLY